MSKDTANINNLALRDDKAGISDFDLMNSYINAPANKLDADEYIARDLDGVTESLLGSGNLNFLMMQAAQTNESMATANPFSIDGSSESLSSPVIQAYAANSFSPLPDAGANMQASRGNNNADLISSAPETSPLNASSATAGVLSASSLAANSAAVNPLSDSSFFSSSSSSVTDALPVLPGTNGNNGNSGNHGVDGTNGTPGSGTTIINENIFETVENIYNDTTNLITEITNNAGDILTTTVNNAGDILTTTVNNAGDVINNLVNNITGGNGLGPVGLSLDATIDGLTNLDLNIINGDDITNVLNETLNTAPILTPVTDLVGNIVSDTSLDVLLNPFQYDNNPNDTDMHIGTDLDALGLNIPDFAIDVPLDAVEGLLGDLDINLDLTDDLLNDIPLLGGCNDNDTDLALDTGLSLLDHALPLPPVDLVLNPVENLTGDVDIAGDLGLGLLGTADAGDTGADIYVPLDLDLMDHDLLNETVGISLDPLEHLIGDVDLDLPIAADILGDSADALIDGFNGGTGSADLLTGVNDLAESILTPALPFNDAPSDTDIVADIGTTLLGNTLADSVTDINIDPVEEITDDLDLDLSGGLDVLPDIILQGTDGGIVDLPDGNDTLAASDLSADLHSALGSDDAGDLLGGVFELIDSAIDTAIHLLDAAAAPTGGLDLGTAIDVSALSDPGSTLGTWTESILPDAGSDLGGGLAAMAELVTVDPIAMVAPAISIPVPSLPLPGIGGLFGGGGHGGGHHGDLFG